MKSKKTKIMLLAIVISLSLITLTGCDLFDCDGDRSRGVSNIAPDSVDCSKLTVPSISSVGQLVTIQYAGEYSELRVLWGDNVIEEGYDSDDSCAHTYMISGHFMIRVTVMDARGYNTGQCESIITISGQNPQGVAFSLTANPTSGQSPLDVAFTATYQADDQATLTTIDWDYGDGATSTGSERDVNHTYQANGSYNVVATGHDTSGRTLTATVTITVTDNSGPGSPPTITISANPTTVDVEGDVTCTPTASDSDGTVTDIQYVWGTGDTTNTSGAADTYHYYDVDGGVYSLYAVATDNDGNQTVSNTITITVNENEAPVADLFLDGQRHPNSNPLQATVGDDITINPCQSSDSTGDIVKWEFTSQDNFMNPKDGTRNDSCSFWHSDVNGGDGSTKWIELTVTDEYGATDSIRGYIEVAALAQCTFNEAQVDVVIDYTGTDSSCRGTVNNRTWNGLGTGETFKKTCPPLSKPSYLLAISGSGTHTYTYYVKLTGTDCESGDTFSVRTVLSNQQAGDANNDVGPFTRTVGVEYNYRITIKSSTAANRQWRLLVTDDVSEKEAFKNNVYNVNP